MSETGVFGRMVSPDCSHWPTDAREDLSGSAIPGPSQTELSLCPSLGPAGRLALIWVNVVCRGLRQSSSGQLSDAGSAAMTPETTTHVIRSYDQELRQLRSLMADMGSIVETQVALATDAIVNRNPAAATRAVEADPKVDALEREVERFVIRLLALRQPMAADLRLIVGALKASDDLERIGDYAANVAKRAIALAQFPSSFSLTSLAYMADLVRQNLHKMITGLDDANAAAQVWRADKAVDDMYNTVLRELMTYMLEDARNITPCTHLLFIARNLERIGDHSTNIAETMYYAATGEELSGPRPKGEDDVYAGDAASLP